MSTLALLAVIFFAALAGTSTGFGTSMILVPILALFFPFPETLVFVGIIHWFGDIWKMGLFWKGRQWRLVLLFGVPGIIASAFGAGVAVVIPEQIALRILGMVLIGYAFFAYRHPRWQVKPTRRNASVGGAASGFLAGAFGLGGAVRGAFLSAFTRKSAVYLFTSGGDRPGDRLLPLGDLLAFRRPAFNSSAEAAALGRTGFSTSRRVS